MSDRHGGFTMIEVIVAAVITAVIAGGGMAAFVASSRMMQSQNSPASAEAADYAQQTIERYRNMIACDSAWFNSADCSAVAMCPPSCASTTWRTDTLPSASATGTESILNHTPAPKRCYQVVKLVGCSGSGPDCYTVNAKVCWGDFATCPCP